MGPIIRLPRERNPAPDLIAPRQSQSCLALADQNLNDCFMVSKSMIGWMRLPIMAVGSLRRMLKATRSMVGVVA
jgi:hypothetical protein